MTSHRSPPPDLRRLAAAAAAANGIGKLALGEVLLIGLNVAALVAMLVCLQSGSRWALVAALLAGVEIISLLPLLVGAHWATVGRVRRHLPRR